MRTITYGQCIKATNNGLFRIADLGIGSLSYEDVLFVAVYLQTADVNALDLSMVISKDNAPALRALSQVISQKRTGNSPNL